MSRPIALAITIVAVFQTLVSLSIRADVSHCVASGRSEVACLKMVGG